MLNHSVTQDLQEKVELFLSCKGLGEFLPSNSHVKVKVYTEQGGMFALFGETEGIQNNPNPDFTRSFTLDYHFEISQKLKFEVACEENSQSIGTMQTTLGNIVGASRKIISEGFDIFGADGAKKGKLIIKYEKVEKNNQVALMTFQSQIAQINRGWLYYFDIFGFFSSNDYVLKLYRITNDFDYVLIYESELHQNSLSPEWKKLQIGVTKICNSDHYRPVKAQVYTRHRSQDTLVGECQFTLNDLINETSNFTLIDPSTKNHTGTLNLRNFRIEERADFLDYIRGGTQLNVIVGIDFTGSNGDPNNPASLHALKFDGTLNEYQQAISSVCSILLDYDYDKKVPVYGFGGKPRGYPFPGVQHCFSLTGDPKNPWVSELPGIMQAYSTALRNVELSGPTLFAPLVKQAMEAAAENRNNGSREYTILLIITDGEIHDMQPTINCMIKSARLPLSVIIVGVGPSNNFENMKILDGDDGLANSEGVEAERDLVQFVPFREFGNNPEALAKHVLEEIPTQLVEYMSLEGIRPPAPAQYNNGQNGGLYPDIASAPVLSGEQLQQSLNYGFVPANINFEKY